MTFFSLCVELGKDGKKFNGVLGLSAALKNV